MLTNYFPPIIILHLITICIELTKYGAVHIILNTWEIKSKTSCFILLLIDLRKGQKTYMYLCKKESNITTNAVIEVSISSNF